MLKKLSAIVLSAMIISGIIGGICRNSYVNCDELEYYKVGLMADELVLNLKDRMEKTLDESTYILKVKCIDEVEFSFKRTYQAVQIEKVYKGENISTGECINISMISSNVYQDDMSINMGFVNKMMVGEEYLVFLGQKVVSIEYGTEIYMTPDYIMAPVFSYKEHNNVIVDSLFEDSLYAYYKDVSENEFFVESEEALNILLGIKNNLIEKYD
ncbi:MAG: hypothetical protein IJA27_06735 [Lachnospiraceae bacterium]|nr:hypothetical protein [Lachnospiraceae bacterium]